MHQYILEANAKGIKSQSVVSEVILCQLMLWKFYNVLVFDLMLNKTYQFLTMHEKFTHLIMKFKINDTVSFVRAHLIQISFSNFSTSV